MRSNKSCTKKTKIQEIPEDITSKRGKMRYLLRKAGAKWKKVSCRYALQHCDLEPTPKNRNYWYTEKSKHGSWYNFGPGLKPLKKGYHNWHGYIYALKSFNTEEGRKAAQEKGWIPTKAKNHYLLW